MQMTRRQQTTLSKNLVGFLVGNVRYAVDIQRVAEIINPLPLVSLPHAPRSVVGVAHHRGMVVPIVELRRRFGLEDRAPTRRTKWVIVRGQDRTVGLSVDAVTEVFGAAPGASRAVPELGPGDDLRGVSAVYAHGEGLVFVLDVDRALAPAEELDMALLAQVAESGETSS
jgi:purine-binding chemotaxis protein CheW